MFLCQKYFAMQKRAIKVNDAFGVTKEAVESGSNFFRFEGTFSIFSTYGIFVLIVFVFSIFSVFVLIFFISLSVYSIFCGRQHRELNGRAVTAAEGRGSSGGVSEATNTKPPTYEEANAPPSYDEVNNGGIGQFCCEK